MTDWLQIAKECFTSSTSYLDANWRKQWERNISLFQSRHPDGSKYNSPAFKHRSRYFRPKTKSVVRKNEAAAAAAFFANVDVVTIEPQDDSNMEQKVSAELMNEIINYRLEESVPWYLTLLGAFQEAQVIGVVSSYQYWMYEERIDVSYEPILDDLGQPVTENGQPLGRKIETPVVIQDKPCVDLIPIENIRFDPAANWTNVVKTSPYVIRCVPMYADAVKQMMKKADPKTGQPKWKKYEDGDIRSAMVEYDTIRQKREGNHQDPKVDTTPLKEFELIWCHENFVKIDGVDMVYWTLGTEHMLTDPKPVHEVYHHLAEGERPLVVGAAVFEAHKVIPDSIVGIGADLQRELNDTANQRRDNVSLVLNKRYFIKRGAQVDVDALMRNVPGGGIAMTDPATDVVPVDFQDVTGSAYAEQDRLNVDFDELTGNFSQSSVSTNRSLNETVGGMRMLGGGAQQLTEYLIRTFAETWVEPVLKQLVKLEQAYESDLVVLALAGSKAQLAQKYGIDTVTDQMLNQTLTTRVNVGLGATDPHAKLQKFTLAAQTYAGIRQTMPDADPEAVRREVFSLAGYKNGDRFFQQEQGPNAQLMAQMQELQQKLQQLQVENTQKDLALKDKSEQNQLKAKELGLKEKELVVKSHIDAYDAETKRAQATKQETPQLQEDPNAELQRQMLLEQFKSEMQMRLKAQDGDTAQMKELLALAASVIEKSLTKPEPTDVKPEGAQDVGQSLSELMSAIDNLAGLIKAPRKKTLIRDPSTGRAIGAVETVDI